MKKHIYASIYFSFLVFVFSFVLIGFAACKQYFADIEQDFEYWTRTTIIRSHTVSPQTNDDNEGFPSVSSVVDAVITLKLHNPQNFVLEMPHNPDTTGRIVYFPAFGSSQPTEGTDYTLEQTDSAELKLTLKHDFLKNHEQGITNLSPTIHLYQKDTGRKLSSYTFKLKCNTPPPKPEIYIGKKDIGGGVYNYILCIQVLDGTNNGIHQSALHTDMKEIRIQKRGDTDQSYGLSIGGSPALNITPPSPPPAIGTFITDHTGVEQVSTEAASVPDWVKGSAGQRKWTLYYNTGIPPSSPQTIYDIRISDEKGLFSGTEADTSKVPAAPPVLTKGGTVIPNDTATPPYEITRTTFAPVSLTAATSSDGATVSGTVEKKGNGGYTEVTGVTNWDSSSKKLNITLNEAGVYKIKLTAEGTGYTASSVTRYVKVEANVTITGGANAWKALKTLIESNSTPSGATIIIDGTITATGDSGNNGEIVIDKNLTIRGKTGKTADILNANSKTPVGSAPATPHRIFHVKAGKKLTLENITLKNGKNNESPLPSNFADSPKGKGGAIYSEGELEIGNVLVTNCEAKYWGGGIYCRMSDLMPNSTAERKFLMENTEVTDCKVTDSSGQGGGVYINGGNCTMNVKISNSTFKKNEALKSGAGLVLHGGHGAVTTADSVVLDSVTLKENELTEPATDYSELSGGAGMAFSTYGKNNEITLRNCTITKNKTGSKGGGIRISTSNSSIIAGMLILENCTVKENTAGEGGGVYVFKSSFTMKGGTIGDNTETVPGSKGGGVYIASGQCTLKENALITENTASAGGGVCVDGSNSKLILQNASITNNEATTSSGSAGGGVYLINGASFEMNAALSCKVTGNKASGNAHGGGVFVSGNSHFSMGGSATVTIEGATNDVYLEGDSKINISPNLAGSVGAARITVADDKYNNNRQVLDGAITAGGAGNENYKKFKVTPKGAEQWEVDNNGKLAVSTATLTGSAGSTTDWKTLKNLIENAAEGAVITVEGEIKATSNDGNYDEIKVTKPLTIKGKTNATSDRLNADCTNTGKNHRIFHVKAGGKLTLENITLTGGKTTSGIARGGAILLALVTAGTQPEVMLENGAKITGCEAGEGGGVFIQSGKLTMKTGSGIESCTAANKGGGVGIGTSASSFKMEGGTISKCTVTDSSYGRGGGVYITAGGKFTMTGGTIGGNDTDKNTAKYGGGVYVGGVNGFSKSEFTLKNSGKITHNATSAGGYGGGVYIGTIIIGSSYHDGENALMNMSGGEVSHNNADYGGGIAVCGRVQGNTYLDISDGIITGNAFISSGSGTKGKGIYAEKGILKMQNNAQVDTSNDVYLNNAYENGEPFSHINVPDTLTASPAAKIRPADYGVGTKILSGNPDENHKKFTVTQQTTGGNTVNWEIDSSGKLQKDTSVTVTTWAELKNKIEHATDKTVITVNGEIKSPGGSNGGEIKVTKKITITIKGTSNNATLDADSKHRIFNISNGNGHLRLENIKLTKGLNDDKGGAILITGNGSKVELINSSIDNCTAGNTGGAIYIGGNKDTQVILDNSKISTCTVNGTQSGGGGIFVLSGTLKMQNSIIEKCEILNEKGGGVYVKTGKFEMEGGEIKKNTAKYGGGVYIDKDGHNSFGNFKMTNGKIHGNSADEGGGVFIKGTFTMEGENSIIGGSSDEEANTANSYGGGIFNDNDFNMERGKIIGNKLTTTGIKKGAGVYMSGNSKSFKMYESAQVAENNDVYLSSNKTINIDSFNLTNDPAAWITPSAYNNTTKVLSGKTTYNENYKKFRVTQEVTSNNPDGKKWKVGTNGYLMEE